MFSTAFRLRACLFIVMAALVCFGFGSCEDDDEDDESGELSIEEVSLQNARDLAATWMATFSPERNSWSWGDGVLLYGMTRLYDQTGDESLKEYAKAFIDYSMETGSVFYANNDNCIPAKTALWLSLQTGDPAYMGPVDGFKRYIYNVVDRLEDGGINHLGWMSGKALWMDTLFMVGPLLLDLYDAENDAKHVEELRDQIRIFASHLRDSETALWRHRFDETTQTVTPEEDHFWARGNGWVLVAMAEFLTRAPEGIEGYEEILGYYQTIAATIKSHQLESGLWTTIVNHSDETYVETSCAALYAYGFAIGEKAGLLDSSYLESARRALKGLDGEIYVDGYGRTLLPGTSLGTSPGDLDYYNQVVVAENVNYGLGAYFLAVTEMNR